MRIEGFLLFVRAFRGDANAARLLMKHFQPPVFVQRLLTSTRNVEVQAVVAKLTHDRDVLVFQFNTEADLDEFERLCVHHGTGAPYQALYHKRYKARVMNAVRSDAHEYSF